MTTKQYILKQLTDRGLWPDEAEAILEQAKPDLEIGGYKITWDRPVDRRKQADALRSNDVCDRTNQLTTPALLR